MRYQGLGLRNQKIELDGNEFVGCQIENCEILYRGGELPVLQNNKIISCTFELKDAAQRTLEFLAILYSMAPNLVEQQFQDIRRSGTPPTGPSGTAPS